MSTGCQGYIASLHYLNAYPTLPPPPHCKRVALFSLGCGSPPRRPSLRHRLPMMHLPVHPLQETELVHLLEELMPADDLASISLRHQVQQRGQTFESGPQAAKRPRCTLLQCSPEVGWDQTPMRSGNDEFLQAPKFQQVPDSWGVKGSHGVPT